jgi:hypothetical protein
MSCRHFRARLGFDAGVERDATHDEALRVHIVHCPDCRAEAQAYARHSLVLRSLGRDQMTKSPAPGVWSAIRSRLAPPRCP